VAKAGFASALAKTAIRAPDSINGAHHTLGWIAKPPRHRLANVHLVDVVGRAFLSFATATPASKIDDLINERASANAGVRASLDAVLNVAAQSAAQAVQTGGSDRLALYPLVQYDETARAQTPNLLREQAGGAIPGIASDLDPESPEARPPLA
jgi:hypothetical protein